MSNLDDGEYCFQGTDAATDLYSASLEYSSQKNDTGQKPINNMEDCVCPEGFAVSFSFDQIH